MKGSITAFSAALALMGCALMGCAGVGPGYTEPARPGKDNCLETLDDSQGATRPGCAEAAFITLQQRGRLTDPVLAFFEFNDDGVPYDRALLNSNLDQLRSVYQRGRRVLQVLFVHGWNHNALQTDSNVRLFKKFLAELQQQEDVSELGPSRQVVGIYLSWPGQASERFVPQLLSFRERKEMALMVGGQNATKSLLAELSKLRTAHRGNRFVLIGHSFGGGFVLRATEEALRNAVKDGKVSTAEVFGDAVVLINPAVEADRLMDLHASVQRDFSRCTAIQLASFTSQADSALGRDFPIGMELFFGKDLDPLVPDARARKVTPYGLYQPLQQFVLEPTEAAGADSASGPLTPAEYKAAQAGWSSFRTHHGPFNLMGLQLRKVSEGTQVAGWSPLINVLVDRRVIPEHSEIWEPQFSTFIRGMVGMQFAAGDGC